MGVGPGGVGTRRIFYCLPIRQRKAPEVCIYYDSQLQWHPRFSFKTKILLAMNDLKATVILIRWKKHSNQMEVGPGALGAGG